MKSSNKKKSKSKSLFLGLLELVSSKIFSEYPKQLTDLIGKQHGVYALYKGKKLYYVGLATNMRSRIKQHLRDKHAGKWDKFSLYLVRKADHIKELETIIMRIASPAGNASKGKLPRAEDLKSELQTKIKLEQERRLGDLLGRKFYRDISQKQKRKVTKKVTEKIPIMAPYVKKPFRIIGTYKGKKYKAVVNKSGSIRYDGHIYNSPSMAGKAARKRNTNGWVFWRYKNKSGEWARLDELRK